MKKILLISALTIGALSLQGCASGSGNYGYQQQSYNGPNLSQIGAAL
jgi:outer membrane lipoprotein SlyB